MAEEPSVVPVFVARNITQADVVAGLLEANGIDCTIQDEEGVTMLDGIVSGNAGVVVTVAAADAADARAVIEEAHSRGHIAADEEE